MKRTKQQTPFDHISMSRQLGLESNEYVLVGGSVLDIHGLRISRDIDVVVGNRAFGQLKKQGWSIDENFKKKYGRIRLIRDVFEIYTDLYFKGQNYYLPFEAVKDQARRVRGVYVQTLGSLLLAKKDVGRAKDRKDCKLIEKALGIKK